MGNNLKIKQAILDELKRGGEKAERFGHAVGRSINTITHWARYREKHFMVPSVIPVLLAVFELQDEAELFESNEEIENESNS